MAIPNMVQHDKGWRWVAKTAPLEEPHEPSRKI